MSRQALLCSLLVLAALLSCTSQSHARSILASQKYAKGMVVFGDSVSDQGKAFKSQMAPDKDVYYKGRFCNGPIWVDYLEDKVKSLEVKNYAFGGATACFDHKTLAPGNENYTWIRSLPEQVDNFLNGTARPKLPQNRFIVIWIGANDISAGFASGTIDGPISALQFVTKTLDCLADQVTRLAEAGEKKIVIFNLPPLDKTPIAQNTTQTIRDAIGPFISAINTALEATVGALKLKLSGTDLDIYNVHDSLEEGYADALTKLGFKNNKDPCVITESLVKNAPVISECANPNNRVWFDQLHPTTNVHKKVIFKGFYSYLKDNKLVK